MNTDKIELYESQFIVRTSIPSSIRVYPCPSVVQILLIFCNDLTL
jgi:hypothetical protein